MKVTLGIDLGTSRCKVAFFGLDGKLLEYAFGEYPVYRPSSSYAEQNPEEWWESLCKSIREALQKSNITSTEVLAIGITGQDHGVVCLDDKGNIIRRAIIYSDRRYQPQIERLEETLRKPLEAGARRLFGPLLWMRENEPQTYKTISKVTTSRGFIGYKLTGKVIFSRRQFDEICDIAKEINEVYPLPLLGQPYGDFDIAGYVTGGAAEETGLNAGIPVIMGPWDGMCSIFAAGLLKEGIAVEIAGATDVISVSSAKFLPDITRFQHVIPAIWLTYHSLRVGMIHDWFKEKFGFSGERTTELVGPDQYSLLDAEAEVELGSRGLIFLPKFGLDLQDTISRGVFFGISLNHDRRHFYRAVLEGIAYRVREYIEELESLGIIVREVRICGGGAKSDLWNQIRADVTGKPYVKLNTVETGCLGASICAGIGVKLFNNLKEATESMVRTSKRFEPIRQNHEEYNRLYEIYREVDGRLKPVFEKLGKRST